MLPLAAVEEYVRLQDLDLACEHVELHLIGRNAVRVVCERIVAWVAR